jgi:hypothetical protein
VGWKVKRASKGYDPHPHVRIGARPTEQDGQITALALPMSVLVFDIRADNGMPAFVTLELTSDAGYGFILARPDQEDETAYVVRSIAPFPPQMPYAWLPLEDFGDLLRWKAKLKAGVGIEAMMPRKLPPIKGFYHDMHLPGPRWRFSAFEQWMLP